MNIQFYITHSATRITSVLSQFSVYIKHYCVSLTPHSQYGYSVTMRLSWLPVVYTRRTADLVLCDLVCGLCAVCCSRSYQCDDGTLGGELRSAEQRPDESVDEFVFRVCARVVIRNLLPLQSSNFKQTELLMYFYEHLVVDLQALRQQMYVQH